MSGLPFWIVWLLIAYGAGTLPFGLLIGRLQGIDLRAHGSGNLGATNVGRVLGKKWGLICFGLDVAKGLLPVLGFGFAGGLIGAGAADAAGPTAALAWLSVSAAAVVGHMFPVWLKFRGGKGVATGLGALLGVWPMLTVPAAVAGLVWLAVVVRSGYVSLASMVAAMSLPVFAVVSGLLLGRQVAEVAVYAAATLALGGLVVVRHRSNITRLRTGTEPTVRWAKRQVDGA